MSEQPWRGRRQAPDGREHQSQNPPQTHVSRQPSIGSQNPQDADKKKVSRFQDRLNTTQGILLIIATLVTLTFGGGSVAVAIKHFTSHRPLLTLAQVKGVLLVPSDLAALDKNFTSADIEFPANNTCGKITVHGTAYAARAFFDKGNDIALYQQIETFSSENDAHTALGELTDEIRCSRPQPSDISGGMSRLCNEDKAWQQQASAGNYSRYAGLMRCGRTIVSIIVAAAQGSSFDSKGTLFITSDIAMTKVQTLS